MGPEEVTGYPGGVSSYMGGSDATFTMSNFYNQLLIAMASAERCSRYWIQSLRLPINRVLCRCPYKRTCGV